MADDQKMSFARAAHRFAEQWPFLRYLGMGAWWAWIWLCYSSMSLFELWPRGPVASNVGLMYLYSTPAIALMCILAAVAWKRSTRLVANRAFIVAFGCIAAVGTLLVAFSPWLGGTAGFAIGGILTGVGTSALCIKTGAVFGTLGRRDVLTAGCVSMMLAAFLYFMGVGLPPSWRPIFVAAMPVMSAFLYIMPGDDPFSADDQVGMRKREKAGTKAFVCLVLASVMVAATAGFGKGLVAASSSAPFGVMGSATTFFVFIGAVAICFIIELGDVAKMARFVYAALILVGVAIVMLSGLGTDLGYLAIGKELLWMLFTCLMAYMVFRFDFSPVRAFGLGQAAYFVSSALSWWFGMLMADTLSGDSSRLIVAAVMVIAIVLVFAFVFSGSDLMFVLTWRHDGSTEDAPGKADDRAEAPALDEGADAQTPYEPPRELTLSERIGRIDPAFGITSREAEIMELFASGRSANWIAEELVISKNTVRSHLRSIYTKLDVHTRQELLDFLATVSGR